MPLAVPRIHGKLNLISKRKEKRCTRVCSNVKALKQQETMLSNSNKQAQTSTWMAKFSQRIHLIIQKLAFFL